MLIFSLITLAVTIISIALSLTSTEEIFKVSMGCTAIISLVLNLFVAPWPLKLAIIAIAMLSNGFTVWMDENVFGS